MLLAFIMFFNSFATPNERQAAEEFYRSPVLKYSGEVEWRHYFPESRSEISYRTGTGKTKYALFSYYFSPTLYEQRIFFGVIDGKFHLFVCDLSRKWDGIPKPIQR